MGAEHGRVYEDAAGAIQRGMEITEFVAGAPICLRESVPRTWTLMSTVIRCSSRSVTNYTDGTTTKRPRIARGARPGLAGERRMAISVVHRSATKPPTRCLVTTTCKS